MQLNPNKAVDTDDFTVDADSDFVICTALTEPCMSSFYNREIQKNKKCKSTVGVDALGDPLTIEEYSNNKLPKRKNTRIPEYDYSKEGMYFITICTKDRKQILSKINVGADDPVRPNVTLYKLGKIVENILCKTKEIHDGVEVYQYVIMPNHIHMIISINGRTKSSAPTKDNTRN